MYKTYLQSGTRFRRTRWHAKVLDLRVIGTLLDLESLLDVPLTYVKLATQH